jgi:hypothetical protein
MPTLSPNPQSICKSRLAPRQNLKVQTLQRDSNRDFRARLRGDAKWHATCAVLLLAVFASALLIPFGEAYARVIYLKPEAYAQHLAIKLGTAVFFCALIVGLIVGSLASPSKPSTLDYPLLGILGAFSAVLCALFYPAQLEAIPEELQLRWNPRDGFWIYSYLYIAYAALGAIIPSFLLRFARQGLRAQ